MQVPPNTQQLNVLCCVYPGEAHETYKRSLIIDVVWYSLGLLSTAANAQGSTAGGLVVSGLMLFWAAFLLFNAPNMARPLSEGLKSAAFCYGWVKLVLGWISIVGCGIFIVLGIVLIAGGTQAQSSSSSSSQAGGVAAGAIGVLLLIMGILLLPVSIIIIQTAKNILGALNAMGSPAYFQPANPGNYHPAPGYGAPAPGYGAPAPGYGAPAPGYGAPAPAYGTPGPMYGAPQPQPGYAQNQPNYV